MKIKNIPVLDQSLVESVEWRGDPIEYDQRLHALNTDYDKFIVINPWSDRRQMAWYIDSIPDTDKCAIWQHEGDWVAKMFHRSWTPAKSYKEYELTRPKLIWNRNPDLDRLMTFDSDPFGGFEPEPWDSNYKLVWYMDPRFVPTDEKIWVMSAQPLGREITGTKDMGYLTPLVSVEWNPDLPDMGVDINALWPPFYDLAWENAWELDPKHQTDQRLWVVKFTPEYRRSKGIKWAGTITPEFTVEYNPDLPEMDYDLDLSIPWYDLNYEHIWLLDRAHLHEGEDDIWAVKIKFVDQPEGSKIQGSCSPTPQLEYNPQLPLMDYDIDHMLPWHDLKYEHMILLDRKHLVHGEEDIWAVKFKFTQDPVGTKILDFLSPRLKIEKNPLFKKVNFDTGYVIPWHDFKYEHMWLLDRRHFAHDEDDIWTLKISAAVEPEGTKTVGSNSPVMTIVQNPELKGYEFDFEYDFEYHDFLYENAITLDSRVSGDQEIWALKVTMSNSPTGWKTIGEILPREHTLFNPALKHLNIDIDYIIPYHDRHYVHVWYLDEGYSNGDKIWAVKKTVSSLAEGEKEVGTVVPLIAERLDVVFISYHEPNAEENWNRVLEKAPHARRVDGVKGIFEAHQAAARLAETDMFYVVDGDAYLVDDWKFDYQPGIFDRDCAYVWYSRNPVNSLTYGYGGVKLFSKAMMLKAKAMTKLDMTTSVMPKLKVIDKVSNITRFDIDAFSVWKSAFRECVKLYYSSIKYAQDVEHVERLTAWLNSSRGQYSKYARLGAEQAVEYAKKNIKKYDLLLKINDRAWLEEQFKKIN